MPISTLPLMVCIDGIDGAFFAECATNARGEVVRWNGWIAHPLFSREDAQKIVDAVNSDEDYLQIEADRFVWAGDTLLQYSWDGTPVPEIDYDSDRARYTRTVIPPDAQGRYGIGAYSWCWTAATADELQAAGMDPGLRDL